MSTPDPTVSASNNAAASAVQPPAARGWFAPVRRHPWLSLLGVIALAIAVLIALWDWNWFKGPIERQVEARTGRKFQIDGNLDVDLGRVSVIRADGLSFANASWAQQPMMATAQRLELSIDMWPLFKGDIRIPDIRLTRPRVNLQSDAKHGGNWVFERSG
ncbi:MAG: AsmA family protein, partial [Lysobacter sp.]|nr:AsmA family protein [Lysobacter sp.]